MSAPAGPLRVLMVMHVPAALELGAARVQLELAEVLRARGCEVRILDRDEILGGRNMGRLGHSPQAITAAACRRVRAMAGEFDVIDAHQGNLPLPKRRLGFDGLMVTRSVGLAPMYAEFQREAQRRWPTATKGHPLARPLRRWRKWRSLRQVSSTFRLCDLIIVPNGDEQSYVADRLGLGGKTAVLPLGISEARLAVLGAVRADRTGEAARIVFIGDWNARKGSHDLPQILAGVRRSVPASSFEFLGTHAAREEVAAALGPAGAGVKVIPAFRSEELPDLLEGARVGALPSYIEGLGLGVLEKLAAGIPSVCYDVPGPRETVGRVDRRLLVPAGDTAAFASRLSEILALEQPAYEQLSRRCREIAREFSWQSIGEQTLGVYREKLASLRGYTSVI